MDRIWANRIWARDFTWSQVPNDRKTRVLFCMRTDVTNGVPGCTPELFTELTGEPFEPVPPANTDG